jgi:hypothetical protein
MLLTTALKHVALLRWAHKNVLLTKFIIKKVEFRKNENKQLRSCALLNSIANYDIFGKIKIILLLIIVGTLFLL